MWQQYVLSCKKAYHQMVPKKSKYYFSCLIFECLTFVAKAAPAKIIIQSEQNQLNTIVKIIIWKKSFRVHLNSDQGPIGLQPIALPLSYIPIWEIVKCRGLKGSLSTCVQVTIEHNYFSRQICVLVTIKHTAVSRQRCVLVTN